MSVIHYLGPRLTAIKKHEVEVVLSTSWGGGYILVKVSA
jgi:hypothetical protein